MSDFQDKLSQLIIKETGGKVPSAEKAAAISEALAAQLGKFIALQCGGNAEIMGDFLDGVSNHMYEIAADTQKAGLLLAMLKQKPPA